ncbi:unnamed protein product [Candidula unifasciata]|uniref:Uncharacterized protein n=1 Tax=Candidula unifasciata TaxID=100452 RepID=A0A8S3ZHZ5_9EUPU|nr:unnamed protein product [Candidula unifasciata]
MIVSLITMIHQLCDLFSSNTVKEPDPTRRKGRDRSRLNYDINNTNGRLHFFHRAYFRDQRASVEHTFSTDQILPACQMPEVDPYVPSVLKISGQHLRTLMCEGSYLPDLTYISGGMQINVNKSKVEEYMKYSDFEKCRYLNILRNETDYNSVIYSDWSEGFKDMIALPQGVEFLLVRCKNTKSEIVSNTYFSLIPRKDPSLGSSRNFKKRRVKSSSIETLNVIMIGMDTLPRHQLLRGCKKTYSYLANSLKSFDLTMHSQLGENTFPNFLPLFTGQSQDEVRKSWSNNSHTDRLDLIWQIFQQSGYETLFTEDMPDFSVFHYFKKGFMSFSTRYNSRPLTLAMYKDLDIWKHNDNCAGNQVELNVHLDYVLRFLDTFPDKPVIAVAMLTKPTHDFPMNAKMFDEHLFNFYQSLNQKGHLNRSLIVSFSDHGVRWGDLRESVNGIFESRSPYTILTFPDWFLKKYPDVAANLRANTKRLTTHFDTHATLLDLLYFKSNLKPLPLLRHGVSLFEEIPANRTCRDAFIPKEFCLCGYKLLAAIKIKSNLSKRLARIVIEAINSQTNKTQCAALKLYQVIRILEIALNEKSIKGERDTTVYKVKLETVPGHALFEANVYATGNSFQLKVGNSIGRLNPYKGQSDCVGTADDRLFCYCNNLL